MQSGSKSFGWMAGNLKMSSIGASSLKQAVKTGVAGALAIFVSKIVGLPEGYWAAISAVIVMQANLGGALRESWVRVLATAIGAAVSIPLSCCGVRVSSLLEPL